MPQWYEPLLAFLAEQSLETADVALTLADLGALAAGALPPRVSSRSYWWDRRQGSIRLQLAASGWRVVHVHGRPATITFVRLSPETTV